MPSIKKTKTTVGGKNYETPYSNVKTSGGDSSKGYVAGGLDIVKAVPGRKGATKKTSKTRRSY